VKHGPVQQGVEAGEAGASDGATPALRAGASQLNSGDCPKKWNG
jgi:hypothetical protein